MKISKTGMSRKTFGLVGAGLALISPFLWWNAEAIGVRLNWQGSFEQVAHENQSVGERALLNQAAVQIFQDYPWTGTGLSTFPYALREKFPDLPVNYSPAHLVFFDAAAELGAFGALAYAGISLFPWAALWLKRKQLVITPELVAASALLLAITAASFFDYYPWFQNPGRLWQWMAWGLWGMIYHRSLSPT
jgi:O-antigen ligase